MTVELSPELRGENPVSPEREKRYLLIGIHGATGVGKGTLARLLSEKFEVRTFEEKFRENPYLEKFYTDPARWSFLSQKFFLEEGFRLLAPLPELLKTEPAITDPARWQHAEIYAPAQHQMGWMTDEEYNTYLGDYETLNKTKEIPTPDVVISIHAPIKVITQRIIDRAEEEEREFELWMLENYSDYFPLIARRTEEWAEENPHNVPIIIVDAHKNNYADDSFGIFRVVTQIQKEVYARLGDNQEVILPDVFQPGELFRDSRAGNLSKIMR